MKKTYDSELLELLCRIDDKITMSEVLSNLLTPQEREELDVRLQIFKRLVDGENQRHIAKALGVSIATVTRGSRELKYGKPGIKKVIGR
ncbi:MAG TPA: Trp family transcriptional regulator [Candidatus Saccharimonadales bacterium]|nr:Trp family transcriptional regulator [Candidatus Saccharimonadales bacterium]